MIVNKVIYNKLRAVKTQDIKTPTFDIVIDTEQQYVRFVNPDKGSSITLFTTANTMRYLKYSIDDLMSEVISKFGYRSDLHNYLDNTLTELGHL